LQQHRHNTFKNTEFNANYGLNAIVPFTMLSPHVKLPWKFTGFLIWKNDK